MVFDCSSKVQTDHNNYGKLINLLNPISPDIGNLRTAELRDQVTVFQPVFMTVILRTLSNSDTCAMAKISVVDPGGFLGFRGTPFLSFCAHAPPASCARTSAVENILDGGIPHLRSATEYYCFLKIIIRTPHGRERMW